MCGGGRASLPLCTPQPSLNGSVVGFDSVVCIGSDPMPTMPVHKPFVLQFANGSRVTAQPIRAKTWGGRLSGFDNASSENASRLCHHAPRKERNPRSVFGYRQLGTGTASGRRFERKFHPCARWRISASRSREADDVPSVHTFEPTS